MSHKSSCTHRRRAGRTYLILSSIRAPHAIVHPRTTSIRAQLARTKPSSLG
ncbi:hypothetical protein HMPREF9248_0140 [Fannyhessea vaginae PB189-T1-4]|uniref:Uncharacterized protein n=1 Tax=Fannyhessea vaginae PB189-T1-4 TaxID=866774 RepID=A0ABN0B1R2_9ACTN|nr:hypothetical protein HMPREF9248_0140 [Fannyhessea vaginae PB189-T1-4]